MKIGNKIRNLRIERNLSPIQVADMLEISESAYCRYETDKNSPSLDLFKKIAQIYNKEIVDLLPDNCVYQENKDYSVGINGGVINHLFDKIVELYENQISELKEQIRELEKEKESKKMREVFLSNSQKSMSEKIEKYLD
ncbi:MAG: helix-turn-helix domain-containing protein [Prevotellaceae bacterium]|jgi:transcriptional regulator with XRE-family HTH domain|nr:helix-turn-helix domain-containing protein [Prevotellaceae bacterium]